MGNTRKLETPRNISCKDGHDKDRNGMNLTEAEDITKLARIHRRTKQERAS